MCTVARLTALTAVFATGMLAGCATPPPQVEPAPTATAAPATAESAALGTMRTFQYLRIDGDKAGITNAADDGRYTYIAFNRRVPPEASFFDREGQPISGASSGRIVALPQIYKTGVLVRIGNFNSFVTPNPRATSDDRPPLESDPEVLDARLRLELASTALPNFKQAMERADQTMREATRREENAPLSTPAATPAVAAATYPTYSPYQVPPLPALKPPAPNDPTYQPVPGGVMIRVFFASGGRAIVRPDDGLQRLEAEAQDAREIRISGFTDSVGSDQVNTYLARQRAEAIRELLIRRGIPEDKLLLAWTGTGRYIADNDTALGRARNRRVEVIFIKGSTSAIRTSSK